MSGPAFEPEAATDRPYRPSGRIDLLRVVPLFVVGLIVAAVMAIVMFFLGESFFFNLMFFGLEALLAAGIAAGIAWNSARQVYYERRKRWASKFEFRLPPSTLETVLAAIDAHDWETISALPRVSSKANANSASL